MDPLFENSRGFVSTSIACHTVLLDEYIKKSSFILVCDRYIPKNIRVSPLAFLSPFEFDDLLGSPKVTDE